MLVISGLPDEVMPDPDVLTQQRIILEAEEVNEQEEPTLPERVITVDENSAISDEPSTGDELNRRRYATALVRMVLHEQTDPPLSIGIHGPWGKGKSSFMAQIREELKQEAKGSQTLVVTVDCNAWRYDDATQVWAGLLNKVSEGIETNLGSLRTFSINVGRAVGNRKTELVSAAAFPLLVLMAAIGLGWLLGVNG